MFTLGISAYFHDSAAVLVEDGKIICAFEEERFSRIKHDNGFPLQAVSACLRFAGIFIEDVKQIAYYEKPLRKLERIMDSSASTYPWGGRQFARTLFDWRTEKLAIERTIRTKLNFTGRVFFYPHHHSHAAAAFYTSPFEDAAVVIVDGVGEYETVSIWQGSNAGLSLLRTIEFPHSLGLLYSTITSFLGFRVNNDEYKVMALAAFGKPTYVNVLRSLYTVHEDGSFSLNLRFFDFGNERQMWTREMERLLGKPRGANEAIEERHEDIAFALQRATEEIYFALLNTAHTETKNPRVCLGGGVALNAVANGKVRERTKFSDVHVFGPAGDSGAAVGAALLADREERMPAFRNSVPSLALGSDFSDEDIEKVLQECSDISYERLPAEKLYAKVIEALLQKEVVAWFEGRMEFGPRALGNRSILVHPGFAEMKSMLNEIKGRESFRPFGIAVLEKNVCEVTSHSSSTPYMNVCAQVSDGYRTKIPAALHVDGSVRIQTVAEHDGRLHRLLERFQKTSGLPCLINTSFNIGGEPIVENPRQALESFLRSQIKIMALSNFLVRKK